MADTDMLPAWQLYLMSGAMGALAAWGWRQRRHRSRGELWRDALRSQTNFGAQLYLIWPLNAVLALWFLGAAILQTFN